MRCMLRREMTVHLRSPYLWKDPDVFRPERFTEAHDNPEFAVCVFFLCVFSFRGIYAHGAGVGGLQARACWEQPVSQ